MSGSLVSICLPTRDRLAFLRQSLAGILAQDHAPLEIVVSDNWSNDGTREHCLTLADRDSRLRYVRPRAPVGLYANHNFALRHATGAYVCFFHDDDLYRPRIVSRYAAFLDVHPTAGAVSSDWEWIDGTGKVLARRRHRIPEITKGLAYIERTLPVGRTTLVLSGSMLRKNALGEDPFDESGPVGFTDMVAWFRLAERHDIGHVREVLWSYRTHGGALSRRPPVEIAADYEKAFTAYCDEYLARHPKDGQRVARWRTAIRRFAFWARFYDTTTRLATGSSPATRGVTTELLRGAPDAFAGASIAVLRLVALTGWRWPFALLARYAPVGRSLIV